MDLGGIRFKGRHMESVGSAVGCGPETAKDHSPEVPETGTGGESTVAEDPRRQGSSPLVLQRDLALEMEADEESQCPLQEKDLKEASMQLVQGRQDWQDGCSYRGEFGQHTKLGFGEFYWPTGEMYRGHFYRDHLHGLGTYTWPDGSSFTGTFYLSRREGYGTLSLKSKLFQGLYKADKRFGPGVETHPDGSQDVGLWVQEHLVKLCSVMPGSFSLLSYPELAHFLTHVPTRLSLSDEEKMEWDVDQDRDPFFYEYKRFLLNDDITLPPDMHVYSTDNSHLPMTSSFRKDLDAWVSMDDLPPFMEDEEPWFITNETPLMVRVQKQTYKFRNKKAYTSWNMAAIMQGDRSSFAHHGPKERLAREMILKAENGDHHWIDGILRDNLASPDVADAKGYTVLAAAAVHCQMQIINLLLDSGADVNKCSDEGLTPLSMCFLLYYPTGAFKPNIAERTLPEPQEVTGRVPVLPGISVLPPEDLVLYQTYYGPIPSMLGTNYGSDPHYHLPLSQESADQSRVSSQLMSLKGRDNLLESLPGLGDTMGNADACSISTFDSNQCVHNFPIALSHDFLERSAGVYSLLRVPSLGAPASDKGTMRSMALSMVEHRKRWQTIQLLLHRGADPNLCHVPMEVLFFAVKTADTDGVKLLLENGARTDVQLSPQLRSLTPLHIAAALPGEEAVQITELLLHAITDVDAQAADQDETYRPHKTDQLASSLKLNNESGPPSIYFTQLPVAPEGGRTALHVACEREDNIKVAWEVVRLLLSHKANPNMLWSGHSPLSLSIVSGNDLIMKELLAHGADPNLPLTKGLGNALCLACDLTYDHQWGTDNKLALIDQLISYGANILNPVTLTQGDKVAVGTAVDYGYFRFFQDRKIAHCPFHTLMPAERETFLSQKRILEYMGLQLRQAVLAKESQWDPKLLYLSKRAELAPPNRLKKKSPASFKSVDTEGRKLIPFFKFCYQCGRSIGVRLSPCTRCYSIMTCSKFCRTRAWNEFHKRDCGTAVAKTSHHLSGDTLLSTLETSQAHFLSLLFLSSCPGPHPELGERKTGALASNLEVIGGLSECPEDAPHPQPPTVLLLPEDRPAVRLSGDESAVPSNMKFWNLRPVSPLLTTLCAAFRAGPVWGWGLHGTSVRPPSRVLWDLDQNGPHGLSVAPVPVWPGQGTADSSPDLK
ncbi:PREDICTED: ankyrin repeat and MYND domain-containing protein 1 [Chrysochloris asiatica]|uniref:Ankyrin repeat and MYND domain-containing protein 1 n=1 Tax=Chrysochloris asiatica TaxID=185453 RepID=A0A9B0X0D2_CHRAS|nr:PREDICTED: ankyrin repeat and MYND domain-containing protein 1 [Chrysochloris asiatica]